MNLDEIEYSILEGEQDGNPVTFRCLTNPGKMKDLFPSRISVYWPYVSSGAGLAPKEVNDLQNLFEDELEKIEIEDHGIVSLVVFGNNRKEWHWYVRDIEQWMVLFNQHLSSHQPYPLEIEHYDEDAWKYYDAFVKWAGLA